MLLLFIAALTREEAVFTVFYLFASAMMIGQWWGRRALKAVRFKRHFSRRAFLGDEVTLQLELWNSGWLPVVWLRVQDNLPQELVESTGFRWAVSLGPQARQQFEYQLRARRRGYYRIGPLRLRSGDILGLLPNEQDLEGAPDHLTVYPKIVPLTRLALPSHSPLGTLRHTQPIFEDPSRVAGKRDYTFGDSLRRIDWKATAAAGRLQVKQFEPSIALETAICLNLNAAEYSFRTRIDATELAIVIAASLANWIAGQRQSVGLITNGVDPLSAEGQAQVLPPRKGRAHLIHILEVLARIGMGETYPLVERLQKESVHLAWGVTLIVITGQVDEALLTALVQARRAGLKAIIVLAGRESAMEAASYTRRAQHLGFPVHHIHTERDLDVWRQ